VNQTYPLTQLSQLPELMALLQTAALTGEHTIEIKKRVKRRSNPQNRALHVWAPALATVMSEAGVTQKKLLSHLDQGVDLEMTGEMIKAIFREIGRLRYGKESTADLTTVELIETYKIVDEILSRVTGCHIEWPDNSFFAY